MFLASVLNEWLERRHLILIAALVFTVGVTLYSVGSGSFGVLVVTSIVASCGFGVMLTNLYNYSSATYRTGAM